ncbi:unnamed protein product [Protopolystoma xenopodis]|uniref:Cadherin domain-containing protein n=1 Tax=Protopolystoma xenopodis TaxID=117903 RepID=A0A3S5ADV8_9PLAT|nr:unnamed protein product [Protopolystoma xenopodis]
MYVSIAASNAVGKSYAVAMVTLIDVNNSPPRVSYPSQTVLLPENTAVNTEFGSLNVADADIGINAVSSYIMTTQGSVLTMTSSGGLSASQSYNYEALSPEARRLKVVVVAENKEQTFGGGALMSATGTVTVSITDANEVAPTFTDGT